MTLDGDLLNELRLIFRIVALLRIIIIVIVVGVDTREVLTTTTVVITSIALLVAGEALRGREEEKEDTVTGKAVIDMGLEVVEGERMAAIVVGRTVGLDHLPWHLAIKIIGLKTR